MVFRLNSNIYNEISPNFCKQIKDQFKCQEKKKRIILIVHELDISTATMTQKVELTFMDNNQSSGLLLLVLDRDRRSAIYKM